MTGRNKTKDPSHQPRRDRMYEEHVQDPYVARGKPPEPSACPECGAVFHKGRWQWGETPADADEHLCPACQRIEDDMPAGILVLEGDFLAAHREEIVSLIYNVGAREKAEHPLERIMDANEEDGELVVRFTGGHLARGAGEAVHHAYQGDLEIHPADRDGVVRLYWRRSE